MDYLIVEAVGDGSGDVTLREYGALGAWRLTGDEARRLARRLVTYADAGEIGPDGAPRDAYNGAAARKVER